jgi:hypothetical protein
MAVNINIIEFRGRLEGSPKAKPESETSETEKAAERERIIAAAVAEAMAVIRRREER